MTVPSLLALGLWAFFSACQPVDGKDMAEKTRAVMAPTLRDLLKEGWRSGGETVTLTREGRTLLADVSCNGLVERFPNIELSFPAPGDWRGYNILSLRVKLTSSFPAIREGGKDVCVELFNQSKAIGIHRQVTCGEWVELRIPLSLIPRSKVSGLKFHMYEGTLKTSHRYRFEIDRIELEGPPDGAFWFDGTPFASVLQGSTNSARYVLETKGGLSMQLGVEGSITSLKLAGREVAEPAAPGGLLVRDAGLGLPPQMVVGSLKQDKEGRIQQMSRLDNLGLAVSAVFHEKEGVISVSGKVENLRKDSRQVTVYFAVPLKDGAWQWWDDLSQYSEPLKDYVDCAIPEVQQDKLPIGVMTLPGEAGIAVGLRMDQPRNFRIGFNAAQRLLYIAYDFALMDLKTSQGKSLNEADFCMVLYGFDPAWGFRSALKRYYEAFPAFFAVRKEFSGGGWTMGYHVAKLAADQVRKYGGRFTWDATVATPEQAVSRRAFGILDLIYLEPQYVQLSLADIAKCGDSSAWERLRKLAAGDEGEWGKYSQLQYAKVYAKNPFSRQFGMKEHEGRKALAVLASAVHEPDGAVALGINGDREWIGDNRIGLMTRCNLSPAIPNGRGGFSLEYYKCAEDTFRRDMGFEVGGFALDCFMWGGGSDYCREHFSFAPSPLTFDPVSRQPCLPARVTDSLWLQELATYAHSRGKILFANLGQDFMFSAPSLDVFGKEGGSVEDPGYLRMMAGQKSLTYMPYYKQSDVSVYAHLLYGIYPGGTAQDPLIYERMVPILDQINVAGWEPVTGARSPQSDIQIERYGTNWLVLHNKGKSRSISVQLDKRVVGRDVRSARMAFSGSGRAEGELPVRDGRLVFDMDGLETVALHLSRVASTSAIQSVEALIRRWVPAQAATFRCEVIPAEKGKDVYEVESKNGFIILRGNTGVSLASAFYHYLKEICHAHISWNGNQLNLPVTLPAVPAKIRVVSPVEVRFAYNYCTHGYTMVWWDWSHWERELDWLALHGMNTALIIEGQEAVWQNTFSRFGYTREEIREWLCAPIYQPWQFMQNCEAVLSPSQSLIDKRVELGRKIVQRCRELGIQPVLQGYYGMLPLNFQAKFPDARIVEQGRWFGRRPDMLHITDSRFSQIAAAFLEEQKKLFGDCRYYAADPFHEGGKTGDMQRGEVYKTVQAAILTFDPQATLVKQCWQTSNQDMFDASDKSRSLALDLWCEQQPFWPKCKGYNGTPWVWCMLDNFGGNSGMQANLPRLINDLGALFKNPERGKLTGLAFVPEGSHQNPVTYELFTEIGWRGVPSDIHAWIANYIHARYGQTNAAAKEAWSLMLQTNYQCSEGQTPFGSVIVAAPRLDDTIRGRTWSPGTHIPYDNQKLAAAWRQMLAAAPQLGQSESFCYDLADLSRQVMANMGRPIYDHMVAAHRNRDRAGFATHSGRLLELIRDLDDLTGTQADWLLGKWVADARAWGITESEQQYLDRCARLLLTTWQPNPDADIPDYANREWNGLLGEYYLVRWTMFVDALADDLEGKAKFDQASFDRSRRNAEDSWINGQSRVSAHPKGETVSLSKKYFAKYTLLTADYSATIK